MDLIERQAAIDAMKSRKTAEQCKEGEVRNWTVDACVDMIKKMPSAQPKRTQKRTETHACDCISRQAAMEEISKQQTYKMFEGEDTLYLDANDVGSVLASLPSAQPTLYGYNIEHLELIARVLQKEDLPPERVVEVLTDVGKIVAIVKDEFEEALRKAVEQCMT